MRKLLAGPADRQYGAYPAQVRDQLCFFRGESALGLSQL
jgi:hypothetical protein